MRCIMILDFSDIEVIYDHIHTPNVTDTGYMSHEYRLLLGYIVTYIKESVTSNTNNHIIHTDDYSHVP